MVECPLCRTVVRKPVKPYTFTTKQLLANERSRKLLLAISRRFEDTGRGRMSTTRTETVEVVHGPAYVPVAAENPTPREPIAGPDDFAKEMAAVEARLPHVLVAAAAGFCYR